MPATDRDQLLLERLNCHPLWRARVENLLEVVEAAAGDGEKAEAAERRVIEARRQRGNEALTGSVPDLDIILKLQIRID